MDLNNPSELQGYEFIDPCVCFPVVFGEWRMRLLSESSKRPVLNEPRSVDPNTTRRPWRTPIVILSEVTLTKGGFINAAVSAEIHFPSLGTDSNQPGS